MSAANSAVNEQGKVHLLCKAGDHLNCPREFFNGDIQADDFCVCDCHRPRLWQALQRVTDLELRQEIEEAIEEEKAEVRASAHVGVARMVDANRALDGSDNREAMWEAFSWGWTLGAQEIPDDKNLRAMFDSLFLDLEESS